MRKEIFIIALVLLFNLGVASAALIVPNEIMQPGTQPREVTNLETPDKCDNCHGLYDPAVEPAHNWRGSMMANAGRDPIFWGTLAVAEQDFDGAGDLCIRCHSTAGWMAGRSTPTDGSALMAGDADGVECDFCHKMTNTDNSEHLGVMIFPFWANNNNDPGWMPGDPIIGYYGSGMSSLWAGSDKLGPYIDAAARHQFLQSKFHRSVDFCGTCHDVSNPAVGDLAANNGTQDTADPVSANGNLGDPITTKAAFNNFPYKYGIVERTFSEYKSGQLSKTLVSSYASLPDDLRIGAVKAAYDSAMVAATDAVANGGNPGDYADGTPRYFSCQSCHMRPVTGQGCNKNPPIRKDLPLHDQTGGNYWMPDAIQYLDGLGKLRLGGGLTTVQIAAMNDGKARAMKQLSQAATLSVNGDVLKVVNTAGHKLISGYPEGRRMWLNIKWYDINNNLIREDGKYGMLTVTNPATGTQIQVESILDLSGTNTKIYEAHYAITKEWAGQLMSINPTHYGPIVLEYDRYTGLPLMNISQLNNSPPGTYHETFHFVLNNKVAKDNRIPPYGMSYEEARKRNALPEPATQYWNSTSGVYNYWDEVALNPPNGAWYATIDLLYQPTSWEYVQFLYLANNRQNAFLANEGAYMLEAWLAKGMAKPYVMASTSWGTAPKPSKNVSVDSLTTWTVNRQGNLVLQTSQFAIGATVGFKAHTVNEAGANLAGSQVIMELRDAKNNLLTTLQGFSGTDGNAIMTWKSPKNTALDVTGNITNVVNDGYTYVPNVITVKFITR